MDRAQQERRGTDRETHETEGWTAQRAPRAMMARAILAFFAHRGDRGATCNEVAAALGLALHSVTPRVLELREAGALVGDTCMVEVKSEAGVRVEVERANKRPTESGNLARVWRRAHAGETVRPRVDRAGVKVGERAALAAARAWARAVNMGALDAVDALATLKRAALALDALDRGEPVGCRYCRERGMDARRCPFCGPRLSRRGPNTGGGIL